MVTASVTAKKSKSIYSTHPGVAMEEKAIARLRDKTGKSLEEWIRAIKSSGQSSAKESAQWLKTEHNIGTNYAAWIASHAAGKHEEYDPDVLVKKMFSGAKSGLLPIYERLLKLGISMGKDVTVTPCSTIVPIRRRYVFAQIKPTTQTRIDLGLALGKTRTPKRLIETGGLQKGDRITHRIPITALAEIDDEVKKWLKVAYELDS